MSGCIWVIADQWRGRLTDATFEMLALAREAAAQAGTEVEVLLLGTAAQDLNGLGGVRAVIRAANPLLDQPVPELHAEAVAQLAAQRTPRAIFAALSNSALGLGSLIADRLNAPFVNFCRNVRAEGGRLQADCVLYGGKIEAAVAPCSEPAVFGILSGARPAAAGRNGETPAFVDAAVEVTTPRIRFRTFLEPDAGGVDLTAQETLVAVGRGIQSQENLELAEELAEGLGGAVCGSRPVIDQGWLPLSRQVGKSGLTVKPKLYIAAGISGAPEHVEGMKDAGLIVAVNSDPGAPIFNVAHYGVTADALDVLPALTEAVRARKGGKTAAAGD